MKNYELLDMIGEANEDYVEAADGNVVRPRFRWRTLAACAACAALVLGAYPAYQAANPQRHDYTVMEGGGFTTFEENADTIKVPAGGGPTADADAEATMEINGSTGRYDAGMAPIYNGTGEEDLTMDGFEYSGPGADIPVQEAALWYDALLKTYRLEENPAWYGGAWIAGERLLAVAIVDGFRTPELESEIKAAAGDEAVLQFSTVKYSMEFLNGLMEPAVRALEGSNLNAGVGVDVMANCLGVDLYSDSDTIPDGVLAALAHLDPDGDAIRVRLFTGKLDTLTDELQKGPAPDPAEPDVKTAPAVTEDSEPIATPMDDGKVYHSTDVPADAVPGGACVKELPQTKETSMPAEHDVINGAER